MLQRGIRYLVAGLLVTVAGISQAQAGFVVVFQPESSNVAAGQFVYSALFTTTVDPGTGEPVESLLPGSFVTLYDVQELTGVTVNPLYASSFSLVVLPLGLTPDLTLPADSIDLFNVSLVYTGPTLTTDTAFTDLFTVTSTPTGASTEGLFAGQTTKTAGPAAGSPVASVGQATVPAAVPEPASAALLGLGLVGGLAARLRRKSA